MLRSMFSGVSGIQSHMVMMDVVGNNIANVNTVGYKSGYTTFKDIMSQTLRGGSSPTAEAAGTNPVQVGLGAGIGSIDANFTQGSLQNTGRSTDLAIQGDGMFILRNGSTDSYSRAGSFSFDANGTMTNPQNGAIVQGWMADTVGAFDLTQPTGDITIPLTTVGQPRATTSIEFGGNLPATAVALDTVVSTIDVRDSQGNARTITIQWEKTAVANEWDWSVSDSGTLAIVDGDTGTITFDTDGSLLSSTISSVSGNMEFSAAGVDPVEITPDWGTVGGFNGLTQFMGSTSAAALTQDGYQSGSLTSFTVAGDGIVTGVFSNGQTRQIAQLALATFNNPSGLLRNGDNIWTVTASSGVADVGAAGAGNRGTLIPSALEMSNVDLAREFTNMIIAQRGFQSNARTVSTADEMLQELVNIKR